MMCSLQAGGISQRLTEAMSVTSDESPFVTDRSWRSSEGSSPWHNTTSSDRGPEGKNSALSDPPVVRQDSIPLVDDSRSMSANLDT